LILRKVVIFGNFYLFWCKLLQNGQEIVIKWSKNFVLYFLHNLFYFSKSELFCKELVCAQLILRKVVTFIFFIVYLVSADKI